MALHRNIDKKKKSFKNQDAKPDYAKWAVNLAMGGLLLFLIVAISNRDAGVDQRTRLYGTWRTSTKGYQTTSLEIRASEINFQTVEGTTDKYIIDNISYTRAKKKDSVRIEYSSSLGEEYILDLSIQETRKGDIIRFVNQDHIVWWKVAKPETDIR